MRIKLIYDTINTGKISKKLQRRDKMRLLYGTGNPAKLDAMKKRLKELDIEIIGLKDVDCCTLQKEELDIPEQGATPLENARQKAQTYYKRFGIPVFSCDSGLFIYGLPDELQPGLHVWTRNGKTLSDEEMIAYYGGLAKRYGNLTARYQNAICLILNENTVFESMADSLASQPFLITAKPHSIRKEGFPLDSLSLDPKSGRYYYDSQPEELDRMAVESGFLEFFRNVFMET